LSCVASDIKFDTVPPNPPNDVSTRNSPVPGSAIDEKMLGADDSATESETESDREALHESFRKQESRKRPMISEDGYVFRSSTQTLSAS